MKQGIGLACMHALHGHSDVGEISMDLKIDAYNSKLMYLNYELLL